MSRFCPSHWILFLTEFCGPSTIPMTRWVRYTSKLANTVEMEGDWEVALLEISTQCHDDTPACRWQTTCWKDAGWKNPPRVAFTQVYQLPWLFCSYLTMIQIHMLAYLLIMLVVTKSTSWRHRFVYISAAGRDESKTNRHACLVSRPRTLNSGGVEVQSHSRWQVGYLSNDRLL